MKYPDIFKISDFINPKIEYSSVSVIIPAAGRGSRLNFNGPKLLFPILGKPICDYIFEIVKEISYKIVYIVSPDGLDPIKEYVSLMQDTFTEFAIQDVPIGMADAIYQSKNYIDTEFSVIIWGDQVTISKKTLLAAIKIIQSNNKYSIVVPTIKKKNPYTHFVRDEKGRIINVLQKRENEINFEFGENDCGVFVCRSEELFKLLENQLNGSFTGNKTGEHNFLQYIPKFSHEKFRIATLRIDDPFETLGINNQKDAKEAERVLLSREC